MVYKEATQNGLAQQSGFTKVFGLPEQLKHPSDFILASWGTGYGSLATATGSMWQLMLNTIQEWRASNWCKNRRS